MRAIISYILPCCRGLPKRSWSGPCSINMPFNLMRQIECAGFVAYEYVVAIQTGYADGLSIYLYICTCIHIYIYTYMYVYVYVYIHMILYALRVPCRPFIAQSYNLKSPAVFGMIGVVCADDLLV